jgi:hypothetical protein
MLPVLRAASALSLALAFCGSAAAAPDLTFSGYSAIVDPGGESVTFTVRFTGLPDFYTTNRDGQVKDSFAFWVDPDAPVAYDRSLDHYTGALPGTKQTFIASATIDQVGLLQGSWVQDSTTYSGPLGANGWGSVQGYYDYERLGRSVSFDVPLASLQDTDGHFYYSLMVLRYGAAEGDVIYNGVSGERYRAPFPAPVPEPSTFALLLTGGLAIGAKARHAGKRQARSRTAPGTAG